MEQRKVARPNNMASAFWLGLCILIAAVILGVNMHGVATSIREAVFTSPVNIPSSLSVASEEKQYMTQEEAAAYLRLTSGDILAMITNGQVKNYIKSGDGTYILSKSTLDEWFKTYSAVTE